MDISREKELKKITHITLLIATALISVLITVMNRIMGWELWIIPIVLGCTAACWIIYIIHKISERTQTIYTSILFMFMVFYYTVRSDTIFECTALILVMIIIFSFTNEKLLIISGIIVGASGIVMNIITAITAGTFEFSSAYVTRIVLHFLLIPLTSVLAVNITNAWKNAEHEYGKTIEKLSEENKRANNFLANVSHEIRTPINAVMGLSNVLEKEELSKKARMNLEAISEAGHRVAQQISDILDFTEIDMGKLSINNETYMISSIVNDLLVSLSLKEFDNLDLVIDLESDIPSELIGDGTKIKKILRHLIGNGLKFTNEGGVNVHIYSVKRVYGINLIIDVSDTGIGMSKDEIEHIYEKFYQSDSGRSRNAGGLGLGIPIVNGFARAMGGVISIESVPGEGTLVRVSIPQEVSNPSSCLSVKDSENCVVAGFLGFMTTGNREIRQYYMDMITHLSVGLNVSFHRVQSKRELERLISQTKITHLFVGTGEYLENREYIDSLIGKMNVALVADIGFDGSYNPALSLVSKPFYGAQVANFLNSNIDFKEDKNSEIMTCPGLKALVVDDEPMNLLVARGIFEGYKMIVSTASSGPESIEKCEAEDYDIVFMDHMMPGMDGVTAMKKLKANALKKGKDLCVVALTANAISSAKEMFLSEGFDGFIPKPIEITELERVLKHVLPKSAIVYVGADSDVYDFYLQDDKDKLSIFDIFSGKKAEAKENSAPTPVQKETKSEDNCEEIMEKLTEGGIEVSSGLKFCKNDKEFYISILKEFISGYEWKEAELKSYYENKDWENYHIKVHALKSTAKLIGALPLSETALGLEIAAKDENKAYLLLHNDDLFKLYREVKDTISHALNQDDGDDDNTGSENDDVMEFAPSEEAMEFTPEREGDNE